MIIQEAYKNPIILNEVALFEKLNVKSNKIRKLCKNILAGDLKIKRTDEKEAEEYLNKNREKIKALYNAVSKDSNKVSEKKDGLNILSSMGVGVASFIAAILGPSAIVLGPTLIPIEIILLLIGCLSWLYSLIKYTKTVSDSSQFSASIDALYKIRNELSKVNIDKFQNNKLKKEYNNLIDELDIVIENAEHAEGA